MQYEAISVPHRWENKDSLRSQIVLNAPKMNRISLKAFPIRIQLIKYLKNYNNIVKFPCVGSKYFQVQILFSVQFHWFRR